MTTATPSFSYFVVMIDYGRRGREATVDPEMTPRGAIDLVRDTLAKGRGVAFVHRITIGELPEDMTDAMVNAALVTELISPADRLANTFDHARKLRAEE